MATIVEKHPKAASAFLTMVSIASVGSIIVEMLNDLEGRFNKPGDYTTDLSELDLLNPNLFPENLVEAGFGSPVFFTDRNGENLYFSILPSHVEAYVEQNVTDPEQVSVLSGRLAVLITAAVNGETVEVDEELDPQLWFMIKRDSAQGFVDWIYPHLPELGVTQFEGFLDWFRDVVDNDSGAMANSFIMQNYFSQVKPLLVYLTVEQISRDVATFDTVKSAISEDLEARFTGDGDGLKQMDRLVLDLQVLWGHEFEYAALTYLNYLESELFKQDPTYNTAFAKEQIKRLRSNIISLLNRRLGIELPIGTTYTQLMNFGTEDPVIQAFHQNSIIFNMSVVPSREVMFGEVDFGSVQEYFHGVWDSFAEEFGLSEDGIEWLKQHGVTITTIQEVQRMNGLPEGLNAGGLYMQNVIALLDLNTEDPEVVEVVNGTVVHEYAHGMSKRLMQEVDPDTGLSPRDLFFNHLYRYAGYSAENDPDGKFEQYKDFISMAKSIIYDETVTDVSSPSYIGLMNDIVPETNQGYDGTNSSSSLQRAYPALGFRIGVAEEAFATTMQGIYLNFTLDQVPPEFHEYVQEVLELDTLGNGIVDTSRLQLEIVASIVARLLAFIGSGVGAVRLFSRD